MSAEDYCAFLQRMGPADLDRLAEVVAPDVHFKDPFNDVHGVAAMRAIFADMFEAISDIRFVIHDRAETPDAVLITWTLSGILLGKPWAVDGASRLRFGADGRLCEHIDYWDAAGGLYERFPVIGWLVRGLRRRLRTNASA